MAEAILAVSVRAEGHRRAALARGRLVDVSVCAALVAFGVLAWFLARPAPDFSWGDVTYYELARSMIDARSYGFDSQPAVLPPGFPAILALLCVAVGCGHAALIRFMVIATTLCVLASYELLRREQGRGVAVVGSLLLASSPALLRLSTTVVLSDIPYFLISLATLALGVRLEAARGTWSRAGCLAGCASLLVAAILIRTAGITLVAGLAAWLIVSFFTDRAAAGNRLRLFLPVLVAGVIAQLAWAHWSAAHQDVEWPTVGGWPRSYVAQLAVKSGNQPELGAATLSDIPARAVRNAEARGAAFMELFTHRDAAYFIPLVPAVTALVVIGLWSSMGGPGGWPAWYFAGHEVMYLLWPWDLELRFILPVAPLALLYAVSGGRALARAAARRPRAAGAWGLALTVPSAIHSFIALCAAWNWRLFVGAIACALTTAVAAWLAWTDSLRPPRRLAAVVARATHPISVRGLQATPLALAGVAALAAILAVATIRDIKIAHANYAGDLESEPASRDVAAGRWIRDHTPATAVIMARQLDVIFHYARRRVVWFPPLSEPHQLMDGIRKHGVDFVVVTDREESYWRPDERTGFERLLAEYPRSFSLVHAGPGFRIFEVDGARRSESAG